MGQALSSPQLKAQIQGDLGVYFYFPVFDKTAAYGDTACCTLTQEAYEQLNSRTEQKLIVAASALNALRGKSEGEDDAQLTYRLAHSLVDGNTILVRLLPKHYPDPLSAPHLITPSIDTPPQRCALEEYLMELESISLSLQKEPVSSDDWRILPGGPPLTVSPSLANSSSCHLDREMLEVLHKALHVTLSDTKPTNTERFEQLNSPLETVTCLHPNVLPVIRVVETTTAFYVCQPYYPHTLAHLLTFSAEWLTLVRDRRLFFVYQLLATLAFCHSRGVIHGALTPSQIVVREDGWLMLTGFRAHSTPPTPVPRQTSPPTVAWLNGSLSTLDYLLTLNRLAGRREGDPNYHPIVPWVIDFTRAPPDFDGAWRDLTKSKYRLVKGDEQLDMLYAEGQGLTSGHHISEPWLTPLSYYNYLARRVPIPVLQKHVRGRYQASEYPRDMVRLYSWTPDEAIPEFYSDPNVFVSLHRDGSMDDLRVPEWAQSYAHFVEVHRRCLESVDVAPWIDLTFGYLLSGSHAVAAKNVVWFSTDTPRHYGFVQLFTLPHPRRLAATSAPSASPSSSSSSLRLRTLSSPSLSPSTAPLPKTKRSLFSNIKSRLVRVATAMDDKERLEKERDPTFETALTDEHIVSQGATATTLPTFDLSPSDLISPRSLETEEESLLEEFSPAALSSLSVSALSDHLREEHLTQFVQQAQRLEPDYRPPSATSSEWYSDYFAAACIVFELFTRQPLRTVYDGSDVHVPSLSSLPAVVRSLIETLLSPEYKPFDLSSLLRHVAFPRYFAKLYAFLLRFNALETPLLRVHFTRQSLAQLLTLPVEGIHLLLPTLLSFYSSTSSADTTVTLHALGFLDLLIDKLGRTQANEYLLPVVVSLLERQTSSVLFAELVRSNMLHVYAHNFGLVSFVQHILPHVRSALLSSHSEIAQLASRALVEVSALLPGVVYVKYVVYPLLGLLSKALTKSTPKVPIELLSSVFVELAGRQSFLSWVVVRHIIEPLLHLLTRAWHPTDTRSEENELQVLHSLIGLVERLVELVEADALQVILLRDSTFSTGGTNNTPNTTTVTVSTSAVDTTISSSGVSILHNVCSLLTQPAPTPGVYKSFCNLILTLVKRCGPPFTRKYLLPPLQRYFTAHYQKSRVVEMARGDSSVETNATTLPEMSPAHFPKFRSLLESRGFTTDDSRTYHEESPSESVFSVHQQQQQQLSTSDLSDVGSPSLLGSTQNSMSISPFSSQRGSVIPLVPLTPSIPSDGGSFQASSSQASALAPSLSDDVLAATRRQASFSSWLMELPVVTESFLSIATSSSQAKPSSGWHPHIAMTFREHMSAVRALAVHDNERFILSGSKDGVVKLWSLTTPTDRSKLTYQGQRIQTIQTVNFVDYGRLFGLCDGNMIQLCDVESGTLMAKLEHDSGYLTFEPFDDERALIAVTGGGAQLHQIDVRTERIVGEWQVSSAGGVRSLCVLPRLRSSDGLRAPFVAVGHAGGYVSIIHMHTGQVRWQWHAHEGAVTDLIPLTMSLITTSQDRNLALWTLEDPPSLVHLYKGHRDPVIGAAVIEEDLFSIAGPRLGICPLRLAPATGENNNIVVKIIHRTRIQKQSLKPNQLVALAAVPLHRLLVVGTEDGLIKIVSY